MSASKELTDEQIVGLAADGFVVREDEVIRLGKMNRHLRTQLGCVKALATLWEEEADEREQASREGAVSVNFAGSLYARSILGREHAATLREMLAD